MLQVDVQEAKTRLSQLLARVEAGEEVVITRDGAPVVQLVPVQRPGARPVGFVVGSMSEEFFAPLPADELDRWS